MTCRFVPTFSNYIVFFASYEQYGVLIWSIDTVGDTRWWNGCTEMIVREQIIIAKHIAVD